jgi:hypothetical protein
MNARHWPLNHLPLRAQRTLVTGHAAIAELTELLR